MRALATFALLAAIMMMHTVHALPRPDLAVRQDGNVLRNESHVFHHLDRNQRTANRDREHRNEAERSGLSVVRKALRKAQRTGMARQRMKKRFIRSPDYSQGDDARDGSNSASSASGTMPTQQPAKAEKQPMRMGNP